MYTQSFILQKHHNITSVYIDGYNKWVTLLTNAHNYKVYCSLEVTRHPQSVPTLCVLIYIGYPHTQ